MDMMILKMGTPDPSGPISQMVLCVILFRKNIIKSYKNIYI